jgi:hypothetical protein
MVNIKGKPLHWNSASPFHSTSANVLSHIIFYFAHFLRLRQKSRDWYSYFILSDAGFYYSLERNSISATHHSMYSVDQIIWYLSSLTLHTAVISTAWSLLCFLYVSRSKQQSTHQCYSLAAHDLTKSVPVRTDCRCSARPRIKNRQRLKSLPRLLQRLKSLVRRRP